ncbi:MAG: membrane dipeptidase, partial [Clostridia bacterium]|nr:membrane dipeptidase [Clostridia bacterium]
MKIFDLHSDTFSLLFDKNLSLDSSELAVNIAAFKSVEKAVQQFAVFLRDYEISSADRYKLVLENGKQALLNSGIRICTRADVLENDEKIIALLSIENAGFIKDVSFVDEFYKDGIVTASLTWNGDNKLAGGALGDASLTSLGVDVIKRMNRLSMAVDLSHLNRKSFYEALKEARFPCATHSGIDFILHHPRNLDDAQL